MARARLEGRVSVLGSSAGQKEAALTAQLAAANEQRDAAEARARAVESSASRAEEAAAAAVDRQRGVEDVVNLASSTRWQLQLEDAKRALDDAQKETAEAHRRSDALAARLRRVEASMGGSDAADVNVVKAEAEARAAAAEAEAVMLQRLLNKEREEGDHARREGSGGGGGGGARGGGCGARGRRVAGCASCR